MADVPEIVATHLPQISAHFESDHPLSDHISSSDVNHLANTALAPPLPNSEERPPLPEDFSSHLPYSLEILTRLVKMHSYSISRPASLPSLLLLCAQHCPTSDHQLDSLPWSSSEHQLQASQLQAKLEHIYKPLRTLLVEQDRKLLAQLFKLLQPSLEKFLSYPASVHSLAWITSHISHPHLGQVVPHLLPHALNWLDCWVSYYKLIGCHVVDHIIATCTSTDLVWFGRADLLSDALIKLLHHTDSAVVKASEKPLMNILRIRHDGTKPDLPGPADLLMKDLITSVDLTSDQEKKAVYCSMILSTVPLLGAGTARWVARLSQLMVSQLDFSPPQAVFPMLSQLCDLCPGCVAREVPVLLHALVKFAYRTSWRPKVSSDTSGIPDSIYTSDTSQASVCLVQVATCDPCTARLLCHGLDTASVNLKFDSFVTTFLAELAVM